MRDLRTQNPGWSREKVAIEALSAWRLQDVIPPESPRSFADLLKKTRGSRDDPAQKSETNDLISETNRLTSEANEFRV